MPIRKALSVDRESKAVNYLLHSEYELNKTSWSKLQKKYNVSRNKIYAALTGKRRPGGSQYTLVAHGSVVRTYMSRAKLFRNPLIDGPGTTFGW